MCMYLVQTGLFARYGAARAQQRLCLLTDMLFVLVYQAAPACTICMSTNMKYRSNHGFVSHAYVSRAFV